ncbi:MAG: hypothetical protein SGPRY_012888 [Prymnesium sp.]
MHRVSSRSVFASLLPICGAFHVPLHATRALPISPIVAAGFCSRRKNPSQMCASTTSRFITGEVGNNVTPYIENLIGRDLHKKTDHPLGIIKSKIESYFNSLDSTKYEIVDSLDPLVKAQACFDDLLIPEDHPGRKPSDTYYVSRPGGREESSANDLLLVGCLPSPSNAHNCSPATSCSICSYNLLICPSATQRTHTSAHQSMLMREGKEAFLCTGDVYRRDEIDASHFPAFHQAREQAHLAMEGVKLFDPDLVGGEMTREEWLESPGCKLVAEDLKKTLEGMCDELFGPVEKRWIDEYFPFTEPSFELEIFYNGDWMEARHEYVGCGVIHSGVLDNVGLQNRHGWAFGLGLERLAMDIAFWIPENFEPNDFFELGRGVAGVVAQFSVIHLVCARHVPGELVEKMDLIDEFTNPKTGKTSHCYRITYRSMDRSLEDEEINKLQFELRDLAEAKLQVELR